MKDTPPAPDVIVTSAQLDRILSELDNVTAQLNRVPLVGDVNPEQWAKLKYAMAIIDALKTLFAKARTKEL